MLLLWALLAGACARELSSDVRVVASSAQNSYRSGFAYPVQAKDGAVVFPSYSTPTSMAITSVAHSGKTTTLASTSATLVPGGTSRFVGFTNPRTAVDGTITFHGSAESGLSGFYYIAANSKTLQTIADTATPVPAGGGATLGVLNGAVSMSEDGGVAFVGAAAVGNSTYRAIYRATSPGAGIEPIIDTNTPMPDHKHNFECLSGPSYARGKIAFFGSHCLSGVLGAVPPAFRSERMVRSRSASSHALHDNYGDDPVPGIFIATLGSKNVTTVATSATPVPNGHDGELFVSFSDPVFDGDTVGFLGLGAQGSFGLYKSSISSNTPLSVVVDTKTPVPGGDGLFGDIPQTPSLVDGTFLFQAGAGGGFAGIYSATSNEDIVPHITFMDSIDGKDIVYMGTQIGSFNGDVFSFYAVTDIDVIGQGSVSAGRRRANVTAA